MAPHQKCHAMNQSFNFYVLLSVPFIITLDLQWLFERSVNNTQQAIIILTPLLDAILMAEVMGPDEIAAIKTIAREKDRRTERSQKLCIFLLNKNWKIKE